MKQDHQTKIQLTQLRRLRISQSALFSVENQERQWRDSVWVWSPENQEQRVQGRSTRMFLRQRVNSPHLCLSVLSGPAMDCVIRARIVRASSSLSLLITTLVSSRNTLMDTTRNSILSAVWVSFNPAKLMHRINYHDIHIATIPKNILLCLLTAHFTSTPKIHRKPVKSN